MVPFIAAPNRRANGSTPLAERFWEFVEKSSDCWTWTGKLTRQGYGSIRVNGKQLAAHRVSWELTKGRIEESLTIDHLCRNKACVNPAHLEPVTIAENTRRYNASRMHCRNGHPYTSENTKKNRAGVRVCVTCERQSARVRGLRLRDAYYVEEMDMKDVKVGALTFRTGVWADGSKVLVHVLDAQQNEGGTFICSVADFASLEQVGLTLDVAGEHVAELRSQRDQAVAEFARLDELHRAEILRLDYERAKLKQRVAELEARQAAYLETTSHG